jgi:hypothetical protein
MTAAVSTVGNEVPRDLPLENLDENTPQKLIDKSKKSKLKTGKPIIGQVDTKEKKVKLGTKNRSKSSKRGRPKISKKSQKASGTGKEESSSGDRSKNAKQRSNDGVKRGQGKRRATRQIPLVPFPKNGVSIAQRKVKYHLQRAESNQAHRQRVLSNRRKVRRRARTTKRKETHNGYLAEYWTEPKVKLDDLSSLDCGSYSDNVEVFDSELEPKQIQMDEADKSSMKQSVSMSTLQDFVFNIGAPEFVPKGRTEKRPSNIFTMRDLMESVKGKRLPSMPNLKKSYPGMCGI